jgi:hypothetical protein
MTSLKSVKKVALNQPLQTEYMGHYYYSTLFKPTLSIIELDQFDTIIPQLDDMLKNEFTTYNPIVKVNKKDDTHSIKFKVDDKCKVFDENKNEIPIDKIKSKGQIRFIFTIKKYSYLNQNGICFIIHQIQFKKHKDDFDFFNFS